MVWDKVTKPFYEPSWRRFSNQINKAKIPYALAIGNHDSDADLTKLEVVHLDKTNPYSLTKIGPSNTTGVTNISFLNFNSIFFVFLIYLILFTNI